MPDQSLGFTFREKMSGGFSMGETDPEKGAKLGNDAGNILTMHATIVIPDLDQFLASQGHPGSISGSIDFVPLGTNLPSTKGVFSLFSPTSDPNSKYMVYELGFNASNGQPYYMAGHKDVRRGSIVHLWTATTTLYTKLYSGTDTTGPVVGAGVISLSIPDLLAMVPTFHAVNAKNAEQAAEVTAKFGKFFLGELWDTYVKM
jgi:hypothetical protein